MDLTNFDGAIIEQAVAEISMNDVAQLSDLQLVLVGGGIGDTQL